jgi:hypothetical protein
MQTGPLVQANLKTPKAAAIAGIVFSVLLIAIFWLFRLSVPADPQEPGSWLHASSRSVELALNLIPFAGIAFLWFIGVLRDRLGELEDRFFATVFLGSGLLFLGMLFTAAAMVGSILVAFGMRPAELIGSATFHLARAAAYTLVNVYMIKMAGVFMITTLTVAIYTGIAPRLVSWSRLSSGATSPLWQLLHQMEHCCIPLMGIYDELVHLDRQYPDLRKNCGVICKFSELSIRGSAEPHICAG